MKPSILRIDLKGVNCYLTKTEKGFILFDTGGDLLLDKQFIDRRKMLEKALQDAGCMPDDLKLVVLTHGDSDHVANAPFIREKYHAKIAMHATDIDLVDHPSIEKLMESFHFRTPLFKVMSVLMKPKIRKATQKNLEKFESFQPDVLLKEESSLTQYGLDAQILHIPGHTKGSIGILTKEGDFISGDAFTNMNGKPCIAINGLDFDMLRHSIERLKAMPLKTIYPGHGEPFEAKQLFK